MSDSCQKPTQPSNGWPRSLSKRIERMEKAHCVRKKCPDMDQKKPRSNKYQKPAIYYLFFRTCPPLQ